MRWAAAGSAAGDTADSRVDYGRGIPLAQGKDSREIQDV